MPRLNVIGFVLALHVLALAYPLEGAANERVSADELKALITGNTVEAESKKGVRSKTYFAPDGTVRSERDGEKYKGRWWVDTEGRRCRQWDGENEQNCRIVVKGKKGTYKVMKGRRNVMKGLKHTGTWKKILDGNPHGL